MRYDCEIKKLNRKEIGLNDAHEETSENSSNWGESTTPRSEKKLDIKIEGDPSGLTGRPYYTHLELTA